MTEKLNAKRFAEALDAFNDGGFEELDRFLSDDIVWHVNGTHPLSGTYRGREAVLDYHRRLSELADEPPTLEATDIIGGTSSVAALVHVHARRGGVVLDVTRTDAVVLDLDGRWCEYRTLSDEQSAIDEFWS